MNFITDYFQQLTGFSPYNFQTQAIAHLLNHQDVILRAPTGSGKTETAIAPFLFAKTLNRNFPNKLIYVVPLRTLANSLRKRAEHLVAQWSNAHSFSRPLAVTLQTGENPEDPGLEGDIIFCTIDQMLSSFLSIPYSVKQGSANLNAGAIFASYLVFDELHLLDPDRALTTTLKVLELVNGIAPFLLMSATLSDELAGTIQSTINRQNSSNHSSLVRVGVDSADLEAIEGHRYRTYRAIATPLTAQTIAQDIEQHQRQRVIAICNTVSQAQGLYRDLNDYPWEKWPDITLLHARFLPQHRAQKEAALEAIFGKHWTPDGKCHILVATQVIEAGLNITCELLHAQLCPMNALLQRAGRCARFAQERGEVRVYPTVQPDRPPIATDEIEPETTAGNRRRFLPYTGELAQACELTWQVLQAHTNSEPAARAIGFQIEADWVDRVHQVSDALQAERRRKNRQTFEEKLNNALFRGDRSAANDLIRQVDNRSIFVWEDQPLIDFEAPEIDPSQLQAFSVPKTALLKLWRNFQNLGYQIDWVFKRIEAPQGHAAETYSQPSLITITSSQALIDSVRILVNPKYVFYDEQIGLELNLDPEFPGQPFLSPHKTPQTVQRSAYRYHMDTYVGHLGCLWTCWRWPYLTERMVNGSLHPTTYLSVRDEMLAAGGQFLKTHLFTEVDLDKNKDLFEYLVFLAIFAHDLGKLQLSWQQAACGWQQLAHAQFNGKPPKSHLLAHTDFDPDDPAQRRHEKRYRRPPHAVEGAFIARDIFKQTLPALLEGSFAADEEQIQHLFSALVMAVGRHHSAWAKGDRLPSTIELHPQAQTAIKQAWNRLDRFLPPSLPIQPANLRKTAYPTHPFDLNRLNEDQMQYFQLYLLLVRALRLCDRRAVQLMRSP